MHNDKNTHFESVTIVIPTHRLSYQQIIELAGCKQVRYHAVSQIEKLKKHLQSQTERLTHKIHEK